MEDKVFSKGFFKYVVKDGKASICSYRGFKRILIVPESLGGYPVARIFGGVFFGCKRLVRVLLPNSITNIREMAFWGCENLIRIEIPDSATTIGTEAFFGCKSLVEVIIPKSVTSIDEGAFDSDVTIVGVKGSYAHEYAIAEGFEFREG